MVSATNTPGVVVFPGKGYEVNRLGSANNLSLGSTPSITESELQPVTQPQSAPYVHMEEPGVYINIHLSLLSPVMLFSSFYR